MGNRISTPQAVAVEILLVIEERLKVQDFVERFKLAVVSSDPKKWVKEMYPNWAKRPSTADAEPVTITEDANLDQQLAQPGEWVFAEEISPEEALAMLREDEGEGQMIGGMADLGGEWMEA